MKDNYLILVFRVGNADGKRHTAVTVDKNLLGGFFALERDMVFPAVVVISIAILIFCPKLEDIDIFPCAGSHPIQQGSKGAVLIEEILLRINIHPTGQHTTGRIEEIGTAIQINPAGLHDTAAAQEKPQVAEIVAVGPGGVVDGKEVTMYVKVGDKVIAPGTSGVLVWISIKGKPEVKYNIDINGSLFTGDGYHTQPHPDAEDAAICPNEGLGLLRYSGGGSFDYLPIIFKLYKTVDDVKTLEKIYRVGDTSSDDKDYVNSSGVAMAKRLSADVSEIFDESKAPNESVNIVYSLELQLFLNILFQIH